MYLFCCVFALLCSAATANSAGSSLAVKKRVVPVDTIPVSSEHVRRVESLRAPTGDKYKRSTVDSVGISGPNDLSWFTDVQVGGQTFSVILDTGSTLMAIPINTCTHCDSNTPHAYYTPSSSSSTVNCASSACTYKTCYPNTNACYFNISYLDTSFIAGGYYTDVVTLAGLSANAMFGAIYQTYSPRSGFASPQADGILGLGYNNPSITCAPNCATPVFDSIVAGNSGVADVFSILLSGDEGVITVGGADPAFHTGDIQYTPIIANSHYYVALQGATIGNQALSGFGNAIIDSGSSYTIFPAVAYNQFQSYLQSEYCSVPLVCGNHNLFQGYCYTSDQYISNLPTMTFTFNGAVVTIPPSNYIVGITTTVNGKTTDVYCLGIASYNEDFTILGDTFMTDTYVVFDRVNNRVGFATGVYSAEALQNAQSTSSSSQTNSQSSGVPTSNTASPSVTATKPTSAPATQTTTKATGTSTQETSPTKAAHFTSDEFTSSAERITSPLVAITVALALVFVLF